MIKIIVTVFDALLLFIFGWVGATAEEKKNLGVSLFLILTLFANLFCIWGM